MWAQLLQKGLHENRRPIYTADFGKTLHDSPASYTFVTGALDVAIYLWRLDIKDPENPDFEYLATLDGHSTTVNCVKFSPDGSMIASCGDNGELIIWTPLGTHEWRQKCSAKVSVDLYDLAWSPDSRRVACVGLDTHLRVYEIQSLGMALVHDWSRHNKYIQGVAWDPRNEMIVTASMDRSVCVHYLDGKHTLVDKLPNNLYFQDDKASKYFRRPAFTPDGRLFLCPTACFGEHVDKTATLVFTRQSLEDKYPKAALTIPEKKASVAVSMNPVSFRSNGSDFVLGDTYNVFAVAALNEVLVHATNKREPLCNVASMHQGELTALTWSPDGRVLLVGSVDGLASVVIWAEGELGEPVTPAPREQQAAPPKQEDEKPVVNVLQPRKRKRVTVTPVGDNPKDSTDPAVNSEASKPASTSTNPASNPESSNPASNSASNPASNPS